MTDPRGIARIAPAQIKAATVAREAIERAQARLDTDQAATALIVLLVTRSQFDIDVVTTEVARREEVFARHAKQSTRRLRSPRLRAIESVTHDVCQGWI